MKIYKIRLIKISIAICGILLHAGVALSDDFLQDDLGYTPEVEITSCGYLNIADAVYVLQNDVSSDGTCFYVTQDNITLDLNGYTVTYDNMSPVPVTNGSFESELNGTWDVSDAPNAARASGTFVNPVSVWDGAYVLKFSTPAPDQYVKSAGSVTIPANTTISLWMMAFNKVSDDITMSVELVGTTGAAAAKTGKTWRGITPVFMHHKTGAFSETYQIRISISGSQNSPNGFIYVDDIRIGRYRAHGITLGATDEVFADVHRCPDCEVFSSTWRANSTVKNGVLKQGQDAGFDCWGIWMGANSAQLKGGHIIENIISETNGPNSKFFYTSGSLYNSEIRQNTIRNSNKILTSRDSFTGTSISIGGNKSTYSKIHHNIIETGPHNAIYALSDGSTNAMEIYNNNITLQTFHTNDFAIVGGGSKIYNNTIDCGSGNNSCRGIMAGSGAKVYDNVISVQQLKRNQEYNGCQPGGAYGIQAEKSTGTEIYGNTVTSCSGDCEAAAFRLNPTGSGENVSVHNNIFKTIAKSGTAVATSMLIADANISSADIRDNVFITNRYWMFTDGHAQGLVFTRNTFKTEGVLDNPFKPFKTYNWNLLIYPEDIVFLDNVYPDEAAKELFVNASFIKFPLSSIDQSSSFYYGWPIKITVKDSNNNVIPEAAVNIKNVHGETVYSGFTDTNGEITTSLYEFRNKAGVKTYYNPHTISVSSGIFSKQQDITMDSAKVVVLSFGSGLDPLDINQDGKIDIIDVQVCVNVLLGIETNPDIVTRVDVDANGEVNVTDVQMVVNKVLEGG